MHVTLLLHNVAHGHQLLSGQPKMDFPICQDSSPQNILDAMALPFSRLHCKRVGGDAGAMGEEEGSFGSITSVCNSWLKVLSCWNTKGRPQWGSPFLC